MVEEKKRNQFVDIMRGIAMLLVVLGHTMTGSTINSQSSFLFNVIWTLQMPLFILISGYVTRYSKELENKSELIFYLKKRTFSYLLPWFIWTVLVRGVIFGENSFLNPRFILWHMDNGYWFLFSIWTITVIYGISNLIGAKITTNRYKRMLATGGAYILGLLLLAGIGAVFGISFLGIKLTLYYMPFFFAGYLYGQVREKLMSLNHGKMIIDIGVATSLMVWIVLLMRFNLYEISDTGLGVIIRAVASMTGCIALCGLCKGIFCRNTKEKWGGGILVRDSFSGNIYQPLFVLKHVENLNEIGCNNNIRCWSDFSKLCVNNECGSYDSNVAKSEYVLQIDIIWKSRLEMTLNWVGVHSLEIYLTHSLLINILKLSKKTEFITIPGIAVCFANFTISLVVIYIVINLLKQNQYLNTILFGKKKRK